MGGDGGNGCMDAQRIRVYEADAGVNSNSNNKAKKIREECRDIEEKDKAKECKDQKNEVIEGNGRISGEESTKERQKWVIENAKEKIKMLRNTGTRDLEEKLDFWEDQIESTERLMEKVENEENTMCVA